MRYYNSSLEPSAQVSLKLRDLSCKDQKYREHVSFSWLKNFGITIDACAEYSRRCAKKEEYVIRCAEKKDNEVDIRPSGLSRSLMLIQSYSCFCGRGNLTCGVPTEWPFHYLGCFCIRVLDNHKSVLTSFGTNTSDDELDLPYVY